MWAGTTTLIIYADNIEPPLAHWWRVAQVITDDLGNFPALVPIDSRLGGLHFARRSGLNFNKTKDIMVPTDQVDFSVVTGGAVIALDHGVAELAQMEVGVLFALRADALTDRTSIRRKDARREQVERSEDSAREDGWKHGGDTSG